VGNDNDISVTWAPWLARLRGRTRLVLTAASVIAVAFFFVSKAVVDESWEAIALAKVGKVRGEQIEPVAMAVERLNSAGFHEDLSQSGDDAETAAQLRRSFRARVTSSSLIELRVRGRSEEEARGFVSVVISRLQRAHAEIAEPAIALMQQRRSQLQARLSEWDTQFRAVSERLASVVRHPPSARRDGDIVVATLLHEQLRTQFHDLEAEIANLNRQLDTLQTMPTALVASPELRRIGAGLLADATRAALGLGLGLLFGILLGLTQPRR
jgi:hypothetical protein